MKGKSVEKGNLATLRCMHEKYEVKSHVYFGGTYKNVRKSLFYFKIDDQMYIMRGAAWSYGSRLDKKLLPEKLDIDPVCNTLPQLIVLY